MTGPKTDFIKRYLARMHPDDRRRFVKVPSSEKQEALQSREVAADLEILSAQHQIAMARQRLHSYSGSRQADHHDQTDSGWTAGPKAACSSNILTRVFDGCRVMSQERSMLASLVDAPEEAVEIESLPPLELTREEKQEVEREVHFAGLTMPVSFDEDEQDVEPEAFLDNPDEAGVDDFFMLDEASTPSEEGAQS
jgi:hypothetical protein